MTAPSQLVVYSPDPAALLRAVLERRHLAPGIALELDGAPPATREVRFQELVEAAVLEPAALQHALVGLLGGLHSADLDLYIWLQADGRRFRLLFGVAQRDGAARPYINGILRRGLEGHLLGSRFDAVSAAEPDRAPTTTLGLDKACGLILGIPSPREAAPDLSNLSGALEALAGLHFNLLVRCSPVSPQDLDIAEANLALISGQAHQLARQTATDSASSAFSRALSEGSSIAESATTTTNWSTTKTAGTSRTVKGPGEEAISSAAGSILGTVVGGVVGFCAGGPVGAAYGAQIGAAGGAQLAGAVARLHYPSEQRTDSRADQTGGGVTEGTSRTETSNTTDTRGLTLGRQISLELVNRQAGLLEEVAEQHLGRIRAGRSLGMWRTSAQLSARSDADLHVVGSIFVGALRGDASHLEPLRLLPYPSRFAGLAIEGMRAMSPPVISGPAHPLIPGAEQPETMLTSQELAGWCPVPSHDLPGIPVREAVHFGRGGPSLTASRVDLASISMGHLVYGGRPSPNESVNISLSELTGHTFVAGTTGAGKTTTIKQLLRGLQALEQPVPFLLLEPAKSEYRDLFEELKEAGGKPLRFEISAREHSEDVHPLRFNPFAAPVGLPLGRHVEALKILLRSCFEMQESLPQLLEMVLFETYSDLGWKDLVTPITDDDVGSRRFPTFDDFLQKVASRQPVPETRVERVVRSFGYEERVERNLVAALSVRLESFRRGLKGEIFRRDELDFKTLLSRPCFINVADVNEPDIRRFLLASLFLRISSEREAARRTDAKSREGLVHLIVLEEAHHFLREVRGTGPGAELVRQSNAVLADAFAELRAYGQAILVADQAPGELSNAVIRNTNIKIVHRLFQEDDVKAMAESMGLDETQRGELRRLRPGECVVFTPSFQFPVVCQVPPSPQGNVS